MCMFFFFFFNVLIKDSLTKHQMNSFPWFFHYHKHQINWKIERIESFLLVRSPRFSWCSHSRKFPSNCPLVPLASSSHEVAPSNVLASSIAFACSAHCSKRCKTRVHVSPTFALWCSPPTPPGFLPVGASASWLWPHLSPISPPPPDERREPHSKPMEKAGLISKLTLFRPLCCR